MYKPFSNYLLRRLIGTGRILERCFDWEAGNKGALRGGERTFEEDKENDFFVPAKRRFLDHSCRVFRLSCGISVLHKISSFSFPLGTGVLLYDADDVCIQCFVR